MVYFLSRTVPDRKSEVLERDALSFTCSRGCSFDGVFDLYKVVNSQGELLPPPYIYTIVNFSFPKVRSGFTGKGNQGTLVASLLIILPLLNAVNRTLGIEDYGSGFLDARGFVGHCIYGIVSPRPVSYQNQ